MRLGSNCKKRSKKAEADSNFVLACKLYLSSINPIIQKKVHPNKKKIISKEFAAGNKFSSNFSNKNKKKIFIRKTKPPNSGVLTL